MRSASGKAAKAVGFGDDGSDGEHSGRKEPQRIGGRPLRVALVVPPYFDVPPAAYGGVEAVVADLADGLVARGHHVYVLGAGKPGTNATFVPTWERTVPEQLGQPRRSADGRLRIAQRRPVEARAAGAPQIAQQRVGPAAKRGQVLDDGRNVGRVRAPQSIPQ